MQTRLNEMRDNGVWFTDGDSPSCLPLRDSGRIQPRDDEMVTAVELAIEAAGALSRRQNITSLLLIEDYCNRSPRHSQQRSTKDLAPPCALPSHRRGFTNNRNEHDAAAARIGRAARQ